MIRLVHGQGRHPDDGVHRRAYVVAHAGEKVLLGHVGLLRLLPRPLRVLPGPVHLRVHALELGHLASEQPQVLHEQAEEHGDDGKRGGVDNGQPVTAHPRDGVVQRVKGEDRHQVPIAVGEAGAVQVAARRAAAQNNGILLVRVHGRRQLLYVGSGLLVLALKDAVEPVKVICVGVLLVSDNVAAVLSYDKRVAQGVVRIEEEDLPHVLGGEPHDHGKAAAAVGHGILAGDAEQNHAVPAAVGSGGRPALPAPQALQKRLGVLELHGIAIHHFNAAVGRIQGGAQKVPRPCAVFDLLPGAIAGISVARRDMRDGFRHRQAELNDRFKMQRYLLVHSGHISGTDIFDRVFAHIVNGYSKKGKHKNSKTNNHRYADFKSTRQSLAFHIFPSPQFSACKLSGCPTSVYRLCQPLSRLIT